jgi:hypothetical protein
LRAAKEFAVAQQHSNCDNSSSSSSSNSSATIHTLRNPARMSGDNDSYIPVLQRACRKLLLLLPAENDTAAARRSMRIDSVCVLRVTSPLRTAQDIDAALALFRRNAPGIDSVLSVTESSGLHASRIKHVTNDSGEEHCGSTVGYLHSAYPEYPEALQPESSQSLVAYTRNSAIYVTSLDCLMRKHSLYGNVSLPYVMLPR